MIHAFEEKQDFQFFPSQVCSGDILQFGVDVMENSRKVVNFTVFFNKPSPTIEIFTSGYSRLYYCYLEALPP